MNPRSSSDDGHPPYRPRSRLLPAALVVAACAALPSCQPGGPATLSPEEARKATAGFQGRSFVPPPKTIDDVTAILDGEMRVDTRTVARDRRTLNRKPPRRASPMELARFHWERGLAAGRVGNVRRQLSGLRRAERLSRGNEARLRSDLLWDLGVAESFAGNFASAIRYREEAIAITPPRRRGAIIRRAASLALIYASSGNFGIADRLLARSRDMLDKARSWNRWSEHKESLTRGFLHAKARILDAKGRFAEAEAVHREALKASEDELRSGRSGKYTARVNEFIRIGLARNLTLQGRLVEAEIEARRALTLGLRRVGRYSADAAYELKWLGNIIAAQGRHAEAEKLAREVVDIYRKIGVPKISLMLARARRELAQAMLHQGRWAEALVQYDAIRTGLSGDSESFEKHFAADLSWATALLGAGRTDEALRFARAAHARKRRTLGDKHYDTAEAGGVFATALVRLGDRKAALAAFARAAPILIARSRQSDDEGTTGAVRDGRLKLILEAYIGLLADIRGDPLEREAGVDAAAEAFRLANFARNRSVQRALDASGARAAARNADLADLARRERDARKRIGALFGLMANILSAPGDQQDASTITALRTRIDRLRGARAALAREIGTRFPDYAALMSPEPATVARVRRDLRAGEAMIVTYVGVRKTFVWAVPRTGKIAFAQVALGAKHIAAVVRDLRRALDPGVARLGDIPAFDVGLSRRVFNVLLAPVRTAWRDAKSLLVVAHGALGQLPFSVLVTAPARQPEEREPLFSGYREVPWLARDHAVTLLPSVSSLATLRRRPAPRPGRRSFVGFGDPVFSKRQAAMASSPRKTRTASLARRGMLAVRGMPIRLRAAPKLDGISNADLSRLPRLPDTASEIRSIALALNADLTRDVFTGARASEDRVRSMDLSGYRVVAFATHGLVPGDLNGLRQPALALSSPAVTGGAGDGLLTMGEILGLKLDADWVVLSACNTASGQGAGAEAVSGLGRAFFYAGTRALLASNWPVETTSARALTTDLFRRQAADGTLPRTEALRRSMLALIDGPGHVDANGRTVFTYAHPIFWAPFSLIGDGAGTSGAGSRKKR